MYAITVIIWMCVRRGLWQCVKYSRYCKNHWLISWALPLIEMPFLCVSSFFFHVLECLTFPWGQYRTSICSDPVLVHCGMMTWYVSLCLSHMWKFGSSTKLHLCTLAGYGSRSFTRGRSAKCLPMLNTALLPSILSMYTDLPSRLL